MAVGTPLNSGSGGEWTCPSLVGPRPEGYPLEIRLWAPPQGPVVGDVHHDGPPFQGPETLPEDGSSSPLEHRECRNAINNVYVEVMKCVIIFQLMGFSENPCTSLR